MLLKQPIDRKEDQQLYLSVVLTNLDRYEERLSTSGNMSAAMKAYLVTKRADVQKQLAKLKPVSKPFKTTLF